MNRAPRIVGIVLVRNEEHFVGWALRNILDFCDEVIVLDNDSTDRTGATLRALAGAHPGVRLLRCEDPNRSHAYVEGFAGEPVWVFGVDGDEIYDPVGLARLRPRILSGEFDAYWRIDGQVLHATSFDLDRGEGVGYGTPPAAVMTKLYNFSILESWHEPDHQRLHGRSMIYRSGFTGEEAYSMADVGWDDADLRCLHLCFFPRSSEDAERPARRRNPGESRVNRLRRIHRRIKDFLANPFSRDASFKLRKYARGPEVRRDVSAFGRPRDLLEVAPQGLEAERVLGRRWLGGATG